MADGGVTPLLPLAARVGLGVRSASVGRAGWVVVLRGRPGGSSSWRVDA